MMPHERCPMSKSAGIGFISKLLLRWRFFLVSSLVVVGIGLFGVLVSLSAQKTSQHIRSHLKIFTLHDADGHIVTERKHPGDLLLLYFGFTYCPDACPTTLSFLARVMKLLTPEEATRMQVAFVSVDPQRDTPQRLREYLSVFDPRFIALSGSPEEIAAAAQAFAVIYRRTTALAGPDTYGFDHTDLVYVINTQGRQVVMLGSHLSEEEALRRLRQHLISSSEKPPTTISTVTP